MKRLFIDVETSPNIVFSWRTGWKISIDEQNIIKERGIICACWKWENEKKVQSITWDKNQNDKRIIEKIIPVLNDADEIVGHNADAFDLAWIKTRALFHNIKTNPTYKCVDTLLYARKRLYLNSNKLNYIAQYLGVGVKIKTEFDLWKKIVLEKCNKSLTKMVRYCKNDVVLVEKVYHRLEDHMAVQTHAGVLAGYDRWSCPKCGSQETRLNNTRISAMGVKKRQMQCRKCGRVYTVSDSVYSQYCDKKGLKKQS